MCLRRLSFLFFCFLISLNTILPMEEDVQLDDDVLVQQDYEDGLSSWVQYWNSIKSFVHEKKVFISEFWRNWHQVGSLFPSSKYLANEMTKHLINYDSESPVSILEVGAGTGIFTKYIVHRALDWDCNWTLDVVEIDPVFFGVLTDNMKNEFGQLSNTRFLCCDITKFETEKQYDFIVSGLPFYSFKPGLVQEILEMYVKLIKPGGTVTFFEYAAIQTLKKPFLTDEEQDTLEAIRETIKSFRALGSSTKESIVWRNFLPARVISVVF